MELTNYMFFQNLKTIHHAIGELLEMDHTKIDQLLNDGTAGSGGTSGTSVPGVTSGTSGTSGFPITGTTNNAVLTYIDSPIGVQAEPNLTFDGTTISLTGNIGASGYISSTSYIASTTFRETYSDLATGGSVTLDLSTANNFRRQFNATATIAFSNPPASNAFGFTLVVVNAGAYSITWPASIDWVGGLSPILTSSGVDVLVFYTYNGGSSYYGFVTGKNLS